jgi:F0F1-type ATP synthase assembly protein I
MADQNDNDANRKSGLAYGAALSLFFSVLICFGIGWLIDRWRGSSPKFAVAGIILGAVLGFYEFYRVITKLD